MDFEYKLDKETGIILKSGRREYPVLAICPKIIRVPSALELYQSLTKYTAEYLRVEDEICENGDSQEFDESFSPLISNSLDGILYSEIKEFLTSKSSTLKVAIELYLAQRYRIEERNNNPNLILNSGWGLVDGYTIASLRERKKPEESYVTILENSQEECDQLLSSVGILIIPLEQNGRLQSFENSASFNKYLSRMKDLLDGNTDLVNYIDWLFKKYEGIDLRSEFAYENEQVTSELIIANFIDTVSDEISRTLHPPSPEFPVYKPANDN